MRNNSVKIDYLQMLAKQISWPLSAFSAFMDNAVESYAFGDFLPRGLRIDIEMGKLDDDIVLKRS